MSPIHVFQTEEEHRNYEKSFRNKEDQQEFEEKFGVPLGPFSESEDVPGLESTNRVKRMKKDCQGSGYYPTGSMYPDDEGSSPSSESSVSYQFPIPI
jgi:hypothetical protein